MLPNNGYTILFEIQRNSFNIDCVYNTITTITYKDICIFRKCKLCRNIEEQLLRSLFKYQG